VQQGMSDTNGTARRYHWYSGHVNSFVEEPHSAICGAHQGVIFNMTDKAAAAARTTVMNLARQQPAEVLKEVQHLVMPAHHDVRKANIDLKRLGALLWLAHDKQPADFEGLLLLQGLGPRTLLSLALVSEVIYGAPSRFNDPARFSFAHGGKDGHPFPVPTKVYDETIHVLKSAIQKAKLGQTDKQKAIKKLSELAQQAEKDFIPNDNFDQLIEKERNESWKYGGRTVKGKAKRPGQGTEQLRLF